MNVENGIAAHRTPTGRQFPIASGRWSAVVTEVGAALRELRFGGLAIIDGFAEDAMATAYRGLPLLPWPNRIADGRYTFDGVELQLPINRVAEGNAIHGLTCWDRWRLAKHAPGSVRLALDLPPRPGYPFALALALEYALSDKGLEVTMQATNTGDRPLPFGAGHHPYFRPRAALDAGVVRVPARSFLSSDARGLPVEELGTEGTPFDLRGGVALGDRQLDHCFGGLERDADGTARVALDDVEVWMSEHFRWVQLYSGDKLPSAERRRSLAIEPMTCPPNAFQTGRDLIRLAPGEDVTLRWGVRIRE